MSEKPVRVEVGQRYANGAGEITVRRRMACCGAWAYCEEGKVDDDWTHDGACCWFTDEWFETATYLGGPEPVKPPAPAKGQRWRDTQGYYQGGKPFTLTGKNELGWCDDGDISAAWLFSAFESGRLTFVDHGKPASSPSQPRTGPVEAANARWRAERGLDENLRSIATPALTALQILQSRERVRQAKREADARAVAAFADFFDCLPDAP